MSTGYKLCPTHFSGGAKNLSRGRKPPAPP